MSSCEGLQLCELRAAGIIGVHIGWFKYYFKIHSLSHALTTVKSFELKSKTTH